MFFTIKLYLHLNGVLMLNWIIWNWTIFDIETVLTLNWGQRKSPVNKPHSWAKCDLSTGMSAENLLDLDGLCIATSSSIMESGWVH